MKRLQLVVVSLMLLCVAVHMPAQTNTYSTVEDSDPEALEYLAKFESFTETQKVLEVTFDLTIDPPEAGKMIYQGSYVRNHEKYRVDAGDYLILSDGTARWIHRIPDREIYIYDATEEGRADTPMDYLQAYTQDEYVLAMGHALDGLVIIEFKPVDRYSEYAKLRLTLQEGSALPHMMEMFDKMGTVTTLSVKTIQTNVDVDSVNFTLDLNAHPDALVEDLRIE